MGYMNEEITGDLLLLHKGELRMRSGLRLDGALCIHFSNVFEIFKQFA